MASCGAACTQLEAPVQVMKRFLKEDVTGFMVSTGIVKASEVEMAATPQMARILAIDAFWPTTAPATGTGTLVASVEDAVRLGVDCVKLLLPWNVNDAEKVLYCQRIGTVVSEAAKWQMPVMVEPVFLNTPRSPEIVEAELEVARVAYDLGADIIKITFPGPDATAKLCAELDIPVVVAGGPLERRRQVDAEGRDRRHRGGRARRRRGPQGVAAAGGRNQAG